MSCRHSRESRFGSHAISLKVLGADPQFQLGLQSQEVNLQKSVLLCVRINAVLEIFAWAHV